MKRTRHGEHLVKVTRFASINAYLVDDGEGGLVLVDTGLSGLGPDFLEIAEELGGPITRVTLTHGHTDHAGSFDELRRLLPEAELSIGAREQRLLEEERRLGPGEPQARVRGSFPNLETYPDRLLEDGDRVGPLRAVASPGHTPGHVSFLDERDGTLIAGDAFQTLGGVAVAGTLRPLFPLPARATWHRPTALESARALRALEPDRVAVGHGGVLEGDTAAALDRAIAAAT